MVQMLSLYEGWNLTVMAIQQHVFTMQAPSKHPAITWQCSVLQLQLFTVEITLGLLQIQLKTTISRRGLPPWVSSEGITRVHRMARSAQYGHS